MDGNLLGPKTAAEFGKVLKYNTKLKYLNLADNQLTVDGQEMWGVTELFDFLDHNHSLLSLNLSNNMMDERCGQIIREKLENNFTLINFDFSMNHFTMEDSRAIQELLIRNKAMFDAERLKEWRERKNMRANDEALRKLYLQEHSNKEQSRMEEEATDIREAELDEKWKKYMLEMEVQKQQIIQQLTEAAFLRQNKKGKKGKKKKAK